MSITAATPYFPNNVIDLLATRIQYIDADLAVMKRPVRDIDPAQTVGVTAATWTPNENSYEMKGQEQGPAEPTIQNYLITVQAFIRSANEENGLAVHSVLTKMIRSMLYRDAALRVGLSSLVITDEFGATERTRRWEVRLSRYFSNELNEEFIYLSNTEFWLETETT
jgi:hypothetical protein